MLNTTFYDYITAMELEPRIEVLDLGPAIDYLKSLSKKFIDTGDHQYMMEILMVIDEMDTPVLIDFVTGPNPEIEAKA